MRDALDAAQAYARALFDLQTFRSLKRAVPLKLRLSASEWRFALTSFAVKVALFWLLESVSYTHLTLPTTPYV